MLDGRAQLSDAPLRVRRAHSARADPALAVAELSDALRVGTADATFVFASSTYDLEALGCQLQRHVKTPLLACTASGLIGPGGYLQGGIAGVSISGGEVRMRSWLMSPLGSCVEQAALIARDHAGRLASASGLRSFGVFFIDGLSMAEEYVAGALYESLGNVPLVGGSAGASEGGQPPAVYHQGRFVRGAATVALLETHALQVTTFATQHVVPTQSRLVITLADPARRRVFEINGENAASAYARAIGKSRTTLSQEDFARQPLMLSVSGRQFARDILSLEGDGSLILTGAIEAGLVVSIGAAGDAVQTLLTALDSLPARRPELLLTVESASRRRELESRGLDVEVGAMLASRGAVGFHGFGEQVGPLHVNHTLTGIALTRTLGGSA